MSEQFGVLLNRSAALLHFRHLGGIAQSGLERTPGKRVDGNVSWVRIPLPPPCCCPGRLRRHRRPNRRRSALLRHMGPQPHGGRLGPVRVPPRQQQEPLLLAPRSMLTPYSAVNRAMMSSLARDALLSTPTVSTSGSITILSRGMPRGPGVRPSGVARSGPDP